MFRKIVLVIVFLQILCLTGHAQFLTVMTYNIRLDNPADGKNQWTYRKDWLCQQIRTANPDIFGIQEGLYHQVKYIDSVFSTYEYIGVGREDGKTGGEFSAIWYNTSRIKPMKQGTFWLSPTPDSVSKGWDAACIRICTYGLFRELASGKLFWAFNTHFDHQGIEARMKSARLLIEKIREMNKHNLPVIVMGDFNSGIQDEPIRMLLETFTDAKSADKKMNMAPDGTFNAFDPGHPVTERIDFIFTGFGAKPIDYQVIRETKEDLFASDHFPVITRVSLR